MKKTLLTLGSPNKNGRTYTPEAIRVAMNEYIAKGKPMFVHRHFIERPDVNFDDVCGQVEDLEITETEMTGVVKVFPTDEQLLMLECRPSFLGKIAEDGTVYDIVFQSFNFTMDPA